MMSHTKPEYHLENIAFDGSSEPCEVFHVADALTTSKMSRRGFAGAGVALGAVLTALRADSASAEDPPKREPVHAHLDQISGLAVSPKGDVLVSVSWDKLLKVWKLPTGQLSRVWNEHAANGSGAPILTLAQSPDGSRLVSGDRGGDIHLWESPAALTHLERRSIGGLPVLTLLFTPKGDRFAAVTWDGDVRMEDLLKKSDPFTFRKRLDAKEVQRLLQDTWKIDPPIYDVLADRKTGLTAFCLSLQGGLLAYADGQRTVHVYDTAVNKEVAEFERKQPVEILVMNRTGRFIAMQHKNRSIIVRDLQTETDSPPMLGHAAAVTAMTLTDDGSILAVGHSDGAIALWSVESGTRSAFCFDPAASSRDGSTFETGTSVTYTQPCGSPIPPSATCTCNCVPGRALQIARTRTSRKVVIDRPIPRAFPIPFFPSGGGGMCSCVPVCSCIPVFR